MTRPLSPLTFLFNAMPVTLPEHCYLLVLSNKAWLQVGRKTRVILFMSFGQTEATASRPLEIISAESLICSLCVFVFVSSCQSDTLRHGLRLSASYLFRSASSPSWGGVLKLQDSSSAHPVELTVSERHQARTPYWGVFVLLSVISFPPKAFKDYLHSRRFDVVGPVPG